MSEPLVEAGAEAGAEAEAGAAPPFERWLERAKPKMQLWRTAAGTALVFTVYIVSGMALLLAAVGAGLISPAVLNALVDPAAPPAPFAESVAGLLVLLATFWGVWLGLWAAVRWFHARPLSSVISTDGRFSLREFGIGAAIAAGYLAINFGWVLLSGGEPQRSGVEIGSWLAVFAPVCIFIFFQIGAEELVFRGYLPQQLAARGAPAVVWALVPSLLFGLMHWANAGGNTAFAIYYVLAAAITGMVLMVMVWRTGSLAAAMGFHFLNNVGGFLFVGSEGGLGSLALYTFPVEEVVRGSGADMTMLVLLLAFVLSPWTPFPKRQLRARRKEMRAAP